MGARLSAKNPRTTKPALAIVLLLTAGAGAAVPQAEPASPLASMPATAGDLEGVLDKIGAEDHLAAGRMKALASEGERLRALLLARGRMYAKLARAGLLPIGGGIDALVEHASRLERLRRALARDLERERAVAQERIALAKRRASLEDRRSLLEPEHQALARSHTAILAAEEREAAFRKAFLGDHGAAHTAVYGSGMGPLDPGELSAGFAALRGRLPFPMEGRVEIKPTHWPGAEGPGLEMASLTATVVRAVYPGRVAFADIYADYGRTVIVDHGAGYYTVSGNLAVFEVKVGDDLEAGQPLGRTGATPRGAVLYFELRRGSETVNPAPWFGI